MGNSTMKSPIEYYGGKSYMTDILQSLFPKNYSLYVEGFGGGASLLLSKPVEPLEIYNDIEKNVYSMFKTISNEEDYKKLADKLSLTYYSNDIRKEFIESLDNDDLTTLDRAYKFIYVNRTSFNGVGGFSVNLLIRRSMAKSISTYLSTIEGLEDFHCRLRNVICENRDIFELIDKYDKEDTFFYLDPPYIQETRLSNTRYRCEFDNELHVKLVDRLLNVKGKVLLSGYDHEIYRKLEENGWNRYEFKSPNALSTAVEVVWYNYDINEGKVKLF